jgi:SPP1 family predicted phage head-tail adaptor
MKAGSLRHRVQIQTFSEARDADGGITPTWTTAATRWASVEPLRGNEFFNASQVKGNVTHRVVMRYYAGLTPTDRIVHDSRNLNIVAVLNPDERNIMTEVLATEQVTGA